MSPYVDVPERNLSPEARFAQGWLGVPLRLLCATVASRSPKGFLSLLAETVDGFLSVGWKWMGPVLLPILAIKFGVMLALVLPGPINVHYVYPNLPPDQVWLVYALMLVGLVPGFGLLLWGFWKYLLYYVSLNLNVAQWVLTQAKLRQVRRTPEEAPSEDARASDDTFGLSLSRAHRLIDKHKGWAYGNVLFVMLGSWVPALITPFLVGKLAQSSGAQMAMILGVVGLVLSLALLILPAAVHLFGTLAFQVVAFEPVTANPIPILKRSVALVWRSVHWAVILHVLLFIITSLIVPGLVVLVCNLTGLTDLLSMGTHWLLAEILNIMPTSGELGSMMAMIRQEQWPLAQECTRTLLSVTVTEMLLPLGTFAFCVLYLDILTRRKDLRPYEMEIVAAEPAMLVGQT